MSFIKLSVIKKHIELKIDGIIITIMTNSKWGYGINSCRIKFPNSESYFDKR